MKKLLLSLAFLLIPTLSSAQYLNPGFNYVDIRNYGAVCDGVTNVQSAVAAAQAAGKTHLFLPANCLWNPSSNLIPGGLDIYGEDLLTSKIWATSPSSNFLQLGPNTQVTHVNLNGKGCYGYNGGLGCATYFENNQDDTNSEVSQPSPYTFVSDVGHSPYSSGAGLNWITCIQHGDGGCIYGQFIGGFDHSAGSAIQADMVYSGAVGQGFLCTREADGICMLLEDNAGSEGTAHTPEPTMAFTTGVKTHGDYLDMFQATSSWDGSGIDMNFGYTGAFDGSYLNFTNNGGVQKYNVNWAGVVIHSGYDTTPNTAPIASASTIAPTGQILHITGSANISTITLPSGIGASINSFCLYLIPDPSSSWHTVTGGNIELGSTAVPNKTLIECYDAAYGGFYPSY
jgi:hypothetical protein